MALRSITPDVDLRLFTNAQPKGLSDTDKFPFSGIYICERDQMAFELARHQINLAVVDTLRLPKSVEFPGKTILILREVPDHRLNDFRRDDGKPWNRVIIPNPASAWRPNLAPEFTQSTINVGWIVRKTGTRGPGEISEGIVVATGGGGSPETRAVLYPVLDTLIKDARQSLDHPITIRQALGPRSGGAALGESDEVFDPGPHLNEVFRRADVIISTAGYNSVLEIATTDTPAMLVPIPRQLDDQEERVRSWGPLVGFGINRDNLRSAVRWFSNQIQNPARRVPVDLSDQSAHRAAKSIAELL